MCGRTVKHVLSCFIYLLETHLIYYLNCLSTHICWCYFPGCFEPLGIQAGEFNDGEIAASSMLKNFTSTDAWCPPKNDENQYLQVDLSRKTEVTKIATQGQIGSKDRHVKTYALLYSDDGKKWEQYGNKGKEKVKLLLNAFRFQQRVLLLEDKPPKYQTQNLSHNYPLLLTLIQIHF